MKKLLLSIVSILFYTGCTPTTSGLDPRTGTVQALTFEFDKMTYNEAVEYCKNLRLGGYSDWRLPTLEESIANSSRKYGNCKNSSPKLMYWSSDDGEGRTKMIYRSCGSEGGIVPIAKAGVECVRKP